MTSAKSIKSEIVSYKKHLLRLESELANLQSDCTHEWQVSADDIVRAAYTDPGDAPGTMGVDFRGPMYVPEQRTKRWKRYCPLCDKTEHTTISIKSAVETPAFT